MPDEEYKKIALALMAKMDALINAFASFVGTASSPLVPLQVSQKMLFDWLTEWFDTYKKPNLKKSSLQNISNCIRLHIKPNIEDRPLTTYSSMDIQTALNKISFERMRQCCYNVYNGAFTMAHKLKMIPENIMVNVDPVKHEYKTGKAMTRKQQEEFLRCIHGNPLEKLYLFYLYTGCRRSEALIVKWSDVDFDGKTIAIYGTKTQGSKRQIPLFASVEELLKEVPHTSEYLFDLGLNKVTMNFKRVQEKLSFPLHLHELRHTFATRCIESGISLKVVQLWLGHSSIKMTADTYSHVLSEFERKEAEKFKI